MAKKTNYNYEKRQKELARQTKNEEKRKKKQDEPNLEPAEEKSSE
ncbi:MAG: hypothetical protein OQL18_03310 [Deltaproteobacteria bacterium]|jgi:hypothetical protein|nr:hypothetical protein [Deltaproteobacteria bacterium]